MRSTQQDLCRRDAGHHLRAGCGEVQRQRDDGYDCGNEPGVSFTHDLS